VPLPASSPGLKLISDWARFVSNFFPTVDFFALATLKPHQNQRITMLIILLSVWKINSKMQQKQQGGVWYRTGLQMNARIDNPKET
jgi:hypothetical protein